MTSKHDVHTVKDEEILCTTDHKRHLKFNSFELLWIVITRHKKI